MNGFFTKQNRTNHISALIFINCCILLLLLYSLMLFNGKYEKKEKLGSGSYGVV